MTQKSSTHAKVLLFCAMGYACITQTCLWTPDFIPSYIYFCFVGETLKSLTTMK